MKQFVSDEERIQLEKKLHSLGYQSTIQTDFGLSLGGVFNITCFVLPVLPAIALELWLLGPWMRPGIVTALIIWPMMSKYFHPYIHKTVAESEAAPLLLRLLVMSSYGRAVRFHHWMHHQYETRNFNLLLGGDWLLGVHQRATDEDIRRYKNTAF
ncbi:MAG: hypothetical protein GY811_12275 [Myxococcales bacterium]|nr:hypothetical protein [Myxococcales bacterium]